MVVIILHDFVIRLDKACCCSTTPCCACVHGCWPMCGSLHKRSRDRQHCSTFGLVQASFVMKVKWEGANMHFGQLQAVVALRQPGNACDACCRQVLWHCVCSCYSRNWPSSQFPWPVGNHYSPVGISPSMPGTAHLSGVNHPGHWLRTAGSLSGALHNKCRGVAGGSGADHGQTCNRLKLG